MKGIAIIKQETCKRPQRLVAGLISAIFLSIIFLIPLHSYSQLEDVPEYDEISVFLMIQGVGGYELNAIYMEEMLYVPVTDLFSILKINHEVSKGFDSVSGFFLQENNRYLISQSENIIRVGNNQIPIQSSDIFKTDLTLFLKSDWFGKAFGLNLNFNFRSLSLELKTSLELPVIKELRLEQMRKNVSHLRGEVSVDTTFKRNYHLFRGGMADWSVISSQLTGGSSDTRAYLGLGSELFGGEANVLLNYSSKTGFEERQQQYRWRWANNDSKIIRQITAGKIQTRSVASIYSPVLGFTATNSPTTFRKSFGSYILTDYTEPGWTVELYINNVIVDFTTADASGFFSFEVPMVYGSSQLMLKFYGPWGEERIKEQSINVPYNFLPKGSLEYNVSGGVVRDSSNSLYSRAETSVGIHRNVTVGGGIEYLSSVTTGKSMPFLNASARFLGNFLFNGEYVYGVKTRGLLSYRLPSNLTFELDYTNYVPGQKAISFNYLEERKASISVPVKIGTFRSFARAMYKQNVLSQITYSTTELLFSTYFKGMSANISGYANWINAGNPYIYSNIALGFKFGRNTTFRPQAQLDLTNKKLISVKAEIEKTISQKLFLSLVYEENIRSAFRSFEVSFRYDLPFAQTSASTRLSNKKLLTTESARGSFAFGSGNGYIQIDNRSSVGRGGITITPFLDINHNGKRDANEPIAPGLNLRLNGGRLLPYQKDSLIRIVELEPYASYLLEFDDNSFENIAWQLGDKIISVNIDPNQFKKIDIPVKVMGEANGIVYLKSGNSLAGQGRILVNFYDINGTLVKQSMTESDGFYNFLGFAPGHYTAMVDTAQLKRLGLIPEPLNIEFEIKAVSIGDIVDDVSFTLIKNGADVTETSEVKIEVKNKPEPIKNQVEPTKILVAKPAEKKTETKQVQSVPKPEIAGPYEVISGNIDPASGPYFIQAGAFELIDNAHALVEKLCPFTGEKCGIIKEGKLYKVRLGYFTNARLAERCLNQIIEAGYHGYIGEIIDVNK